MYEPEEQDLRTLLFTFAVLLLLALFTRCVTVERFEELASEIGEVRNDIGRLESGINDTTDSIRNISGSIEIAIEEITNNVRTAEAIAETSQRIGTAIGDVSDGLSTITDEIAKDRTGIEQLITCTEENGNITHCINWEL